MSHQELNKVSANLIGLDFNSLLVAYGTSLQSENKVRNGKTNKRNPSASHNCCPLINTHGKATPHF